MQARLEQIEKQYIALLQAKLPAALDAEEAFWAAPPAETGLSADALALPDIRQWYSGNITDDALRAIIGKLPAVTVEAVNLNPASETVFSLIDPLIVRVFTRGGTPEEANKLNHRYASAIATVLSDDNNRPRGVKEALRISVEVAETLHPANAPFLKAARIVCQLRISSRL